MILIKKGYSAKELIELKYNSRTINKWKKS